MQIQAHTNHPSPASGTPVYWHFPMSFNCHKTSVALAETGLTVEKRVVDLLAAHQLQPTYMAVNPKGLVPCLQLPGGVTLADSADIVRHLAKHVTGRISLLPSPGSEARSTAEAWFERGRKVPMERLTYARKALPGGPGLIDLRIAMIRQFLAAAETPRDLVPHYQTRLDGYLGAGTAFQSRGEAQYTDAMRETLEAQVRGDIDDLDALLASDGRPFIAGDAYSLADCMWTAILARLGLVGLAAWWTGGERASLDAYFARLRARPSYAQAGVLHEPVRKPE